MSECGLGDEVGMWPTARAYNESVLFVLNDSEPASWVRKCNTSLKPLCWEEHKGTRRNVAQVIRNGRWQGPAYGAGPFVLYLMVVNCLVGFMCNVLLGPLGWHVANSPRRHVAWAVGLTCGQRLVCNLWPEPSGWNAANGLCRADLLFGTNSVDVSHV